MREGSQRGRKGEAGGPHAHQGVGDHFVVGGHDGLYREDESR